MKTLYKNAYLLQNSAGEINIIKNGCLAVQDGEIIYAGSSVPNEKFDCVKDMSGKIIMPGLYNCHTHSPMTLLRGVGSGLPLQNWLFDCIFPIENRLTKEDIRIGSELALLEMIAGGTVSFSDMYFHPEETAEAVGEAGIMANLSRHVQAFPFDSEKDIENRINESLSLIKNYDGAFNGRVKADFSIHAEYTCSEKTAEFYSSLCSQYGGNMHIHLSETYKEHLDCKDKYGKTPAMWFNSLGAFESSAFLAHCVAIEDEDVEIIKQKNVSVVHNPTSNMKLGSGFMPLKKLLQAGINICLGTDGAASNNNLNMFEEMHLAGIIHNGYEKDATAVSARDVINMATINGAALQRRENRGALTAGNRADFIAINTDKPHLHPCLDVPALIVYSASASDVCLTVCDGKTLYEDGEFKTLDKEKIIYNAERAAERLYNR
ncbi:MAG: amidohydrolase [Oscillospiraceae bacterium]|nr:amidohydrolase [Oscillospiraceae bacterium]